MEKLKIVFLCLLMNSVDSKFFDHGAAEKVLKSLIDYESVRVRRMAERTHSDVPETFYYSAYEALSQDENSSFVIDNLVKSRKQKRASDMKFRGKPKTMQEVWARNFNISTQEYSQSTSLIALMTKVISKYMGACIPIVLYDDFVETSEGFILQRLFETFPTSLIHGRILSDYTLENKQILMQSGYDSKCRSIILFIADAQKARQIIGPQLDNRVVLVPRSTQWKLQEFLSSPLSRDIINLLVIGESYSADKTIERPYVLYTHQLYTDGLGSNKPKVLTSWLKGRLSRPHIDLFPLKLTKGFAGHRFSVSAANVPPFVFKILRTDGVGNVHVRW